MYRRADPNVDLVAANFERGAVLWMIPVPLNLLETKRFASHRQKAACNVAHFTFYGLTRPLKAHWLMGRE
ncbi:hypothetical protein D3C76_1505660 [compost metagenome]